MKKPDRVTITTFWLDWLLLPIMLGAGWLTFRWALADFNLASSPGAGGTALPPWAVAVPLAVCAVGWVILGFGSLIRQEYYEHRIWIAILTAWSISCLIGAGLIGLSFLQGDSSYGLAGVLSLIGLVLTALMLSLPAFMQVLWHWRAVFLRARCAGGDDLHANVSLVASLVRPGDGTGNVSCRAAKIERVATRGGSQVGDRGSCCCGAHHHGALGHCHLWQSGPA
jgi:hypothetical protein